MLGRSKTLENQRSACDLSLNFAQPLASLSDRLKGIQRYCFRIWEIRNQGRIYFPFCKATYLEWNYNLFCLMSVGYRCKPVPLDSASIRIRRPMFIFKDQRDTEPKFQHWFIDWYRCYEFYQGSESDITSTIYFCGWWCRPGTGRHKYILKKFVAW